MRVRIKIKTRKSRKPAGARARPWIAVGTLAACGAAGIAGQPAIAQSSAAHAPAPAEARRYDISAGQLDAVLAAFQKATGMQVQLAKPELGRLPSSGLAGMYTVDQALRRLLQGTGTTHRFDGADSVVIDIAGIKTSVEVTDTIVPLSSAKYTAPVRDLPQTVSIIPRSVMEQQGATSLTEVLRNVPGLTITAGEGGAPAGDNLTLRGFSARNDVFVDGVRDLGPQSRDPFNIEQVEVVKGPQSAYTGRGSTGGSINMATKLPNLNRSIGGSLTLGNADMRRGTVDINTPLSRLGLGDRTALRLNTLWHDSGAPGRDVVYNARKGIAPSLMFGAGRPTRLTLSYFKLDQNNLSD
jgi:catecholate siderophore receptor